VRLTTPDLSLIAFYIAVDMVRERLKADRRGTDACARRDEEGRRLRPHPQATLPAHLGGLRKRQSARTGAL
jgi:hypothetical protein